jgi:hypothetical protein
MKKIEEQSIRLQSSLPEPFSKTMERMGVEFSDMRTSIFQKAEEPTTFRGGPLEAACYAYREYYVEVEGKNNKYADVYFDEMTEKNKQQLRNRLNAAISRFLDNSGLLESLKKAELCLAKEGYDTSDFVNVINKVEQRA